MGGNTHLKFWICFYVCRVSVEIARECLVNILWSLLVGHTNIPDSDILGRDTVLQALQVKAECIKDQNVKEIATSSELCLKISFFYIGTYVFFFDM